MLYWNQNLFFLQSLNSQVYSIVMKTNTCFQKIIQALKIAALYSHGLGNNSEAPYKLFLPDLPTKNNYIPEPKNSSV